MIENSPIARVDATDSPETIYAPPQIKDALLVRLKSRFEAWLDRPEPQREGRICSLSVSAKIDDLLATLHQQKSKVKIYWADRDESLVVAGFGEADLLSNGGPFRYAELISTMQHRLGDEQVALRYFGGFRFYEPHHRDNTWAAFGQYRFVVPRVEIRQTPAATIVTCNYRLDPKQNVRRQFDNIARELSEIDFGRQNNALAAPAMLSRRDIPDFNQWEKIIAAALLAFGSGALKKIVLARKSTFTFQEALDPLAILRRLKAANPQLFYYYFQVAPDQAFIGGSPERLYKRVGLQVKSEAIAGTRPRGATTAGDDLLGRQLLASEKDRREHQFVLDSIQQTLEQLCQTVDVDDDVSLLKLARLQHICCRLQGILRPEITDANLLQRLHPTPAVGGMPTEPAIRIMRELEPFDRGWYAAPVGWISRDAAEFAVAIRSALVQNNQLSLFSGAGIVRGSTAVSEWDEIENKIANFLKVLRSQ